MSSLDLVLWSKGTLLTPQHLQAQDRYLDELLRLQLGALTFCPWGITRLEIDREALAGGTVVVRAAAGRFPDGLLFDAPGLRPIAAAESAGHRVAAGSARARGLDRRARIPTRRAQHRRTRCARERRRDHRALARRGPARA